MVGHVSSISLGSEETGFDRWATSSTAIGAFASQPKKPPTAGRAPGTAMLIGRAQRASRAAQVLGSTISYEAQRPPPVAVSMLGKRTKSDNSLYMTLGLSQNMGASATAAYEASLARSSRADALEPVAERTRTTESQRSVTFQDDAPALDADADAGEDAPLSPTLDEHVFGATPLNEGAPVSFGIDGYEPPADAIFGKAVEEEASVDVLTLDGRG